MDGLSRKRPAESCISPSKKRSRAGSSPRDEATAEARQHDEEDRSSEAAGQICSSCSNIDFESIFNAGRQKKTPGKAWHSHSVSLSHILRPEGRDCPLCRLFHRARIAYPDTDSHAHAEQDDAARGIDWDRELDPETPAYEMRVFSMRRELGATELGDSLGDDMPGFAVARGHRPRHLSNYQNTGGVIMAHTVAADTFSPRQLGPQIDLSIVKEWLGYCDTNHAAKFCRRRLDPWTPTEFRVIDCKTREVVLWDGIPSPKEYVTLSYVWGSTAAEGGEAPADELPRILPKTIDDSILVTETLGFRYLWVDRYCIRQNDLDVKQLQIHSMGRVYENSTMTIIAAAGDGPHHGLPGVGTTPREAQPRVRVGDRTLMYTPYVRGEIVHSRWNSRGWTYQEGLLSWRKLVFTDTQVYFQCNAMHCLESIRAPLRALHTRHRNVRMRDKVEMCRVFPLRGIGKNRRDITDRINEYVQRSLTFDGDALDAFKGILSAFRHKFPKPVFSFCGLPLLVQEGVEISPGNLICGLSWWTGKHLYKDGQMPRRRREFPSWTWVGWVLSRVDFGHLGLRGTDGLVDMRLEYGDGQTLPINGPVLMTGLAKLDTLAAFVHICGPTLDVQIDPDGSIRGKDEGGILESLRVAGRNSGFAEDVLFLTRGAHPTAKLDGTLQFTLLMMASTEEGFSTLVLYQPAGLSHFERITNVLIYKTSDFLPALTLSGVPPGWTRQEVKIG